MRAEATRRIVRLVLPAGFELPLMPCVVPEGGLLNYKEFLSADGYCCLVSPRSLLGCEDWRLFCLELDMGSFECAFRSSTFGSFLLALAR